MIKIFCELIKVALGSKTCLEGVLSSDEWWKLYLFIEKQSLLGICFSGIKEVQNKELQPPESFYYDWLAAATQIQHRNEHLNEQCVRLLKKFSEAGIRCSILKGQGIARLYDGRGKMGDRSDLSHLRQPGDIDIYVDCGREKAIEFAKSIGQTNIDWDYKHLHLKIFKDTEVEMHYRVEVLLNLWKNRKLQKWFNEHSDELYKGRVSIDDSATHTQISQMETDDENFLVTPSLKFNRFYILLHIYRHFLYEGVGLKQVMDYYMVLTSDMQMTQKERNNADIELRKTLKEFGMMEFAKGLMWVMGYVFVPREETVKEDGCALHSQISQMEADFADENCLHSQKETDSVDSVKVKKADWMICEPDEKEGQFILHEILEGGNFGQYDKRLMHGKGKMNTFLSVTKHNMHLLWHYPSDVIWAPIWFVYHWFWKKVNK